MILPVIEKRLLAALRPVHSPEIRLVSGPSHGPDAGYSKFVEVSALNLAVLSSPSGEENGNNRGPAFFSQIYRWGTDGKTRDFSLPEDIKGDVI